ncbi:MAG: knotted carbamoyltransferase YgeW [Candidatus Aminicenantes bacterium]|nr:knotted carbamoyltransferase YgeW [Candidatus Aminicenantes bacterium]
MNEPTLDDRLRELAGLQADLANRDFLLTWEHSLEEIRSILLTAQCLRTLHEAGRSLRLFDTGLAVSIFRDQSTRTRFSFASAANALGLTLSDLDEAKSQIAHGETTRETAVMISFLAEAVGIRDDIYLGEGHRYMRDFAAALQEGYEQGALSRRPSVINLQCDIDHPTQTLADLLHLERRFGGLAGLRGRKFVISWAYSPSYGKPLSVPQGLIGLLPRLGMDVTLAHPEGYDLLPEVMDEAKRGAASAGGAFRVSHNMAEAFDGSEIVYPKSWTPMRIAKRRTELLRNTDRAGLQALEKEGLEENARHKAWSCDEALMKRTAGGSALYMHCLPADISGVSCPQGEVSREVFERYRLETYHEASWKPFVIAALIFLTRMPDPQASLLRLADAATPRIR